MVISGPGRTGTGELEFSEWRGSVLQENKKVLEVDCIIICMY